MVQSRYIAACAAVLLSACASQAPIREPIEVERVVYVRVDPGLTAHEGVASPRNDSGRELLRVARERKRQLQVCYGKLDRISEIEGTPAR